MKIEKSCYSLSENTFDTKKKQNCNYLILNV